MRIDVAIQRMLRPIERKVRAMVARAVLDAVIDSGGFQTVRVTGLADSDTPDIEHLQPGGMTHRAASGAEGVLLRVGGDGSHLLVLALANRADRPTGLAEGETALYTLGANAGIKVYCKADGTVHLGTASATNFVALANLVGTELTALKNAIAGAAVVAGDGGASFKAAIGVALTAWPASVAATKAKAL